MAKEGFEHMHRRLNPRRFMIDNSGLLPSELLSTLTAIEQVQLLKNLLVRNVTGARSLLLSRAVVVPHRPADEPLE